MKDLKILNARIPDFDAETLVEADILVDGGKIVKIAAPGQVTEETKETIDAAGQIAAPGFIDMHAHEDKPEDAFFTSECCLRMGVTTKIAGNCGEIYDDLDSFVKRVENGCPTNYMMFIGQGYLREKVGATDWYTPATPEQIEAMKEIIRDWKQYGPVGLSFGFEYTPGVEMDEILEVLKEFEGGDNIVSVHFRSDGPEAVKSTEELVEICKRSGCKMEMSHIGSCAAMGYMEATLDVLDKANAEGVDITADCYPYNAFCTGIGTAVFDEGAFDKWDYEAIMLTDGPDRGKRCDKELFEKTRKEHPEMAVVAFVMNEPEIDLAYKHPLVMVGSDCGFNHKTGHPRGAGTFPRVLGYYVRERKALTLMEALRKMTIQPAKRMNLDSKGQVKEGFDADLVLFDENTIRDGATFEEPTLPPVGISYVVLNGQIAVKNNEIVNDRLGRYIPYKTR